MGKGSSGCGSSSFLPWKSPIPESASRNRIMIIYLNGFTGWTNPIPPGNREIFGLGLAITRNAVLLHRGSVKVTSLEGQGTCFTVKIPLTYVR